MASSAITIRASRTKSSLMSAAQDDMANHVLEREPRARERHVEKRERPQFLIDIADPHRLNQKVAGQRVGWRQRHVHGPPTARRRVLRAIGQGYLRERE